MDCIFYVVIYFILCIYHKEKCNFVFFVLNFEKCVERFLPTNTIMQRVTYIKNDVIGDKKKKKNVNFHYYYYFILS